MKKIISILAFSIITLFIFSGFLMPNQAFKPSAILKYGSTIILHVKLGKNIYLHKKDVKISLNNSKFIYIKTIKFSKSTTFSHEQIFMPFITAVVKIAKKPHVVGNKKIVLIFSYIGCSKDGICYRPQMHKYTFNINTNNMQQLSLSTTVTIKKHTLSKVDKIVKIMNSNNIILTLLMFFGFGILLSFTPCVFPMIPIVSSIIVSQGKDITTKKAFFLSLVYVLSMAFTYTIAGILAGLFGENLQAFMQVPWVIYSFSTIFVLLSLSMFGLYELQIPHVIQSKLNSKTSNKGGIIGIAIMGFLSALIVGPCVAAPLAGVLVYIGETGNAILGGISLFTLAIGMGIPLLIVGTGAGKFMPKPGAWMNMVMSIFGILMLGVAIWMLSRVIEPYIIMILYSILGIGTAIYLGALEPLNQNNNLQNLVFKKIIAFIIFLYSIFLFIGVLSGTNSYTLPLNKFVLKNNTNSIIAQPKLHFKIVTSIKQLNIILKKYKGQKIILDFSANWCVACKELENNVFSKPKIIKAMTNFILVRADLTKYTKDEIALAKKYGVFGPPVIIFFNKNGQVIKNKTLVGYEDAKTFFLAL